MKFTAMLHTKRTDAEDPDFKLLVRLLDAELAIIDGSDHAFYSQYNKIDLIKHAIVIYQDNLPVACGAIKEIDANTTEIKRMYTVPEQRGKGVASLILTALETWAKELSYQKCVLETGKRQEDAVALYQKNGYQVIPNYGQYVGVANSVCFEKIL